LPVRHAVTESDSDSDARAAGPRRPNPGRWAAADSARRAPRLTQVAARLAQWLGTVAQHWHGDSPPGRGRLARGPAPSRCRAAVRVGRGWCFRCSTRPRTARPADGCSCAVSRASGLPSPSPFSGTTVMGLPVGPTGRVPMASETRKRAMTSLSAVSDRILRADKARGSERTAEEFQQ
jgi:hypothetical protein